MNIEVGQIWNSVRTKKKFLITYLGTRVHIINDDGKVSKKKYGCFEDEKRYQYKGISIKTIKSLLMEDK